MSKTKKSMTSHLVTLPMLTGLMKRLRPKRSGYVMLGQRIRIIQSLKPWSLSVQFSLFFYHSSALLVTLECEQFPQT
jgi:hypothetical protein